MFLSENNHITLKSVLPMSWGPTDAAVKGRAYSALSWRIRGDCELTENGRTERLRDGDFLYMPQKANYHFCSGDEEILVVHFLVEGEYEPHMQVFHPDDPQARQDFRALCEVWNQKAPGYYFRALSLFYNILSRLEADETHTHSTEYMRIREAADYLHSHYTDPTLKIEDLCRRAFMSDTYFRRLFLRTYHESPRRYLNRLRLDHAKALLREGTCSVRETAILSGFSDPKYFSTVFRQSIGLSPSQYRGG